MNKKQQLKVSEEGIPTNKKQIHIKLDNPDSNLSGFFCL